jgi:hypothetical protein
MNVAQKPIIKNYGGGGGYTSGCGCVDKCGCPCPPPKCKNSSISLSINDCEEVIIKTRLRPSSSTIYNLFFTLNDRCIELNNSNIINIFENPENPHFYRLYFKFDVSCKFKFCLSVGGRCFQPKFLYKFGLLINNKNVIWFSDYILGKGLCVCKEIDVCKDYVYELIVDIKELPLIYPTEDVEYNREFHSSFKFEGKCECLFSKK